MENMTLTTPTTQIGADWLEQFTMSLLQSGRSPKTIAAYSADLALFADWFAKANGCPFTPELLNGWDLRQFREWQLAICRVSAKTWNRRRATLSTFCAWVEKFRIQLHFSMDEIPAQEEEEAAPDWLTDREFHLLVRYLENSVNQANTPRRKDRATRDWAMAAVMLYAGLRVEEVASLLVEDLTLSDRKGRILVRRGKGDKAREVPLNSEARRALTAWLGVQLADPSADASLFSSDSGDRITTRAIEKRITSIGEAAKIANLHPHRLRHTCAKRMIDSGVPITVVQKILGHARIQTTARYTQPGWEDLEQAVEAGTLGSMANRRQPFSTRTASKENPS